MSLAGSLAAQVITTTYTGTYTGLDNVVVTSGKVVFTLEQSQDTTISGRTRFVTLSVTCQITGAGLKAFDGIAACVVTKNTALTPQGTHYRVDVCPQNACTARWTLYALTDTADISTVVPTPATLPVNSVVDLNSNQTIGGTKTFSGDVNIQGTGTFVNTAIFSTLAKFADGTSGAPSIAFNAEPGTGFARLTAQQLSISISTLGTQFLFDNTGIRAASSLPFGWSPASNPFGNPNDTALSRCAALVVCAGNGTSGSYTATYKGTTVLMADGNAAAPSYSFFNAANMGMYRYTTGGNNDLGLGVGGADAVRISANLGQFVLTSGYQFAWGSAGVGAPDTTLARASAKKVNVGNAGDATGTLVASVLQPARLKCLQGSAVVSGDFSISGWGSTASIASVGGTDCAFEISITSSGTGQVSGPTITLTYHDGTWTTVPIVVPGRADNAAPNTQNPFAISARSATAVTFYLHGTPIAGNTYILTAIVIGKP